MSTKTETIPCYEKSLLNDLKVVAEGGSGGYAPDGIPLLCTLSPSSQEKGKK
jgi:hypothetical protein